MKNQLQPSLKNLDPAFVQDLSETQAGELRGGSSSIGPIFIILYSGKNSANAGSFSAPGGTISLGNTR